MTITVPSWLLWAIGGVVAVAATVCAVTLLLVPRRRPATVPTYSSASERRALDRIAAETTEALAPVAEVTETAGVDEGQAARDAVRYFGSWSDE